MSKLRQQQAINSLENLADQTSRTIDILLNRRDVVNDVDEKVEVLEELAGMLNDWADGFRGEQGSNKP